MLSTSSVAIWIYTRTLCPLHPLNDEKPVSGSEKGNRARAGIGTRAVKGAETRFLAVVETGVYTGVGTGVREELMLLS